jgi:hypothetical protein
MLVHEAVMGPTDQGQVVDVGGPMGPLHDVMRIGPEPAPAVGKGAAKAVAVLDLAP